MFKKAYHFFDKLEDKVRGRLSRYPIIYTLIGGTAIVLFWRGVWDTADQIFLLLPEHLLWLSGPISIVISTFILLITGLFVSFFVTDSVLISGLRQEKKLVEKTESEVREETAMIETLQKKLEHIEREVHEMHRNQ